MTETIALFGGSFDPPHVAHVLVACWAKSGANIDRVLMVPAFAHAFGKQSVSMEHRMAMCRLATSAYPFIEVSDIEQRLGQSRTFHTLEALREEHPEAAFRLLVGSDILESSSRWFRWDDVVRMAPPLVIGREGYGDADDALALPNLSSTDLRHRIRSGHSTEGRLPLAVAEYARTHRLYEESAP